MISVSERVAELRARIRELIERRPTGMMAVAVGILCAVALVVIGPIAFYMLRQDIRTALLLSLGWGAVALVAVAVDTAARYLRSLVAPRSRTERAGMSLASATVAPGPPVGKPRPVVNPTTLPPPPTVHYRHDAAPELDAVPTAPTWAELRASGTIGPDRPLYIGWDMTANLPVYATWDKQLGSLVIVGDAGSGKTTMGAAIACQAVMQAMGKCLIVCDLEAGKVQSLTQKLAPLESALLRPIAQTPEDIVEAIEYADQVAQSRHGDGHPPLVVFVEEWTSLRDLLSPPLRKRLDVAAKSLAARGRKVNVVMVLFSQVGTKEACGPVRDYATTTFVFRSMPAQVRYAVETTIDLREYPDGTCYLRLLDRLLERVATPLVEDGDIVVVGSQLRRALAAVGSEGGSTGGSIVRLVSSGGNLVGTNGDAPGTTEPTAEGGVGTNIEGVTPEQRNRIIRAAEMPGKTPARIAKDVLGAPEHGGELNRRAALVCEILRQHRAELASRVAELEAERERGAGGEGASSDAGGGGRPGGDTVDG